MTAPVDASLSVEVPVTVRQDTVRSWTFPPTFTKPKMPRLYMSLSLLIDPFLITCPLPLNSPVYAYPELTTLSFSLYA